MFLHSYTVHITFDKRFYQILYFSTSKTNRPIFQDWVILGFIKKVVLKNVCIIRRKTPEQAWAGLKLYLKKRLWHRCFLVNFVKLLRTPFLRNTSGWLFLHGLWNIPAGIYLLKVNNKLFKVHKENIRATLMTSF